MQSFARWLANGPGFQLRGARPVRALCATGVRDRHWFEGPWDLSKRTSAPVLPAAQPTWQTLIDV